MPNCSNLLLSVLGLVSRTRTAMVMAIPVAKATTKHKRREAGLSGQ